ncbi:prepilin-type N-terminal cleavage/methylation domain-containing protein [Ideonella sp. DXS22W]|uniref:Prepilin-type N-terminal cleavage/methylation domain-containing protein n=1 Tax=Pseudaquabacterium inlustre TaxID=2984192 RepID=A0ABU9CL53_9BURK
MSVPQSLVQALAARPRRRPGVPRRRAGFTLIELTVCLALLGVLALLALPMHELTRQRGQELELRRALREIRGALDAWKAASDAGRITRAADASGWPPSLQALVDGVPDARSAQSQRLVFLRRLPRDPFADPALPAARTWLLRSSDSPHDAPRPGRDVFDVRSSSEGRALDGSALASW